MKRNYSKEVLDLRNEIIREIISKITSKNMGEVIIEDDDDSVYVLWFDRHSDIHESEVKAVQVEDGHLYLVVGPSEFGDSDVTLEEYDFAFSNISWMAEILGRVEEVLG